MQCEFAQKWIEFQYDGSSIRLQGITDNDGPPIDEVTIEQIVKWDKGNELWATAVFHPSEQESPSWEPVPLAVQDLLE